MEPPAAVVDAGDGAAVEAPPDGAWLVDPVAEQAFAMRATPMMMTAPSRRFRSVIDGIGLSRGGRTFEIGPAPSIHRPAPDGSRCVV
jgi:hypothetical protein